MKAVAWLALGLSLVGTLLAAGTYWRVRSTGSSGDLDSLKARVARLEGAPVRPAPSGTPAPPSISSDPGHPSATPAEVADLRRRLEVLERQGPVNRGPRPPEGGGPTIRPKASPDVIEAQRKRFLDTNQQTRSRLAALNMLRMQGAHKTDDIVDSALTLLGSTPEANLKAAIIRSLQGAENARLVPHLVQALKGDPSEDIRDESAKVLGDYLANADAKAALEQAATGDASERVKSRAKAALTPK